MGITLIGTGRVGRAVGDAVPGQVALESLASIGADALAGISRAGYPAGPS